MFISLWAHFCPHLFSQILIGMMAWGAMWNSIVQEKYPKQKISLMAPNIEFYYLFFLLHTLCLTYTDSHKNLLEDSSFGLKSIIFSFWHLWGIKLYLYLFYWNSSEQKVFLLVFEVKKKLVSNCLMINELIGRAKFFIYK